MSNPIPRRLLPHSASLSPYVAAGNPPTYGTSVTLSNIRVESIKRSLAQALGEAKDDRFLLFFDCRTSVPHGQTFKKKDKITFDGMTLSIREIVPQYGSGSGVHHYEVYLV